MKTKSKRELPENAPETYEELVRFYAPRKIHDRIAQQNATEIVDWLAVRAHTTDQVEFLDLISDLLEEYESELPTNLPPADRLEVLRHLVQENHISTRELGRILEVDHSVAARILKGTRSITVEHAKHLGARFKVDPHLFLDIGDRGSTMPTAPKDPYVPPPLKTALLKMLTAKRNPVRTADIIETLVQHGYKFADP